MVEVPRIVERRGRHLVQRRLHDPVACEHRRIGEIHLVGALEIAVRATKRGARRQDGVRDGALRQPTGRQSVRSGTGRDRGAISSAGAAHADAARTSIRKPSTQLMLSAIDPAAE
jgi:hypothetical protein